MQFMEVIVAEFTIRRREAKTGTKKERVIAKLSMEEVNAGEWTRGAGGAAHHFFIDGISVCGRRQIFIDNRDSMTRKLCPECFAAVNRTRSNNEVFG